MGNMDTCAPRHITHFGYVVGRFARTVCRGEHSECVSWVHVVENRTHVVGIVCRGSMSWGTDGMSWVQWMGYVVGVCRGGIDGMSWAQWMGYGVEVCRGGIDGMSWGPVDGVCRGGIDGVSWAQWMGHGVEVCRGDINGMSWGPVDGVWSGSVSWAGTTVLRSR